MNTNGTTVYLGLEIGVVNMPPLRLFYSEKKIVSICKLTEFVNLGLKGKIVQLAYDISNAKTIYVTFNT